LDVRAILVTSSERLKVPMVPQEAQHRRIAASPTTSPSTSAGVADDRQTSNQGGNSACK